MPKVSWDTDKAKRNRERQVANTPRNDLAKKEGGVVRGTDVNPSIKYGKDPFASPGGAGSAAGGAG